MDKISIRRLKLLHYNILECNDKFNINNYDFINGDMNDIRIQNLIYKNEFLVSDLIHAIKPNFSDIKGILYL
jgi:hypothetical protein